MKLEEYISYDGQGIAGLLRQGEVSINEVMGCALQAAELINPEINSIIELFDQPLKGRDDNTAPFYGVPFLIKDLALHAENTLYEMGSRLTNGLRTPHDTYLMQGFRRAGLQTIGRCSTPEFGYCPTTEPIANGPTHNPWDLTRMPGGSSGATAAAVAAGIVPLAHANDGGGSIRIPASCCGLFGLKPSRGRISNGPDMFEPLSGLAVEFAVTRTVRDAASLLECVHGPGPGEPFVLAAPVEAYSESIQKPPEKLRIAYMSEVWSGAAVHEDVKTVCEKSVALCESLGHDVELARPEINWQQFFDITHVLWTANIAVLIDHVATMTGREISENTLEHTTLACYHYGKQLKAEELLKAQMQANDIRVTVGRFFEQFDIFLTPTLAQPPLPLGTINANDASLDARDWSELVFGFCPFTPLFNMTGQPAMSVPLGRSSDNLPVGTQFVGRHAAEDTLLKLAAQLEQAQPWPQIAPLITTHMTQGV